MKYKSLIAILFMIASDTVNGKVECPQCDYIISGDPCADQFAQSGKLDSRYWPCRLGLQMAFNICADFMCTQNIIAPTKEKLSQTCSVGQAKDECMKALIKDVDKAAKDVAARLGDALTTAKSSLKQDIEKEARENESRNKN